MNETAKVFSLHSIQIEGINTRVAQVTCGHCNTTATIRNNSQSRNAGFDDDVIEARVAAKFEKLGWKIAKTPAGHRCPACFSAIKLAAVKKRRGAVMEKEKVVSIAAPPRSPSRDEKRIIFQKIDEFYVGETVGYSGDWSDDRIAEDLNVPVAWVATIRDENFGPNISEAQAQAEVEYGIFMTELSVVKEVVEKALTALVELDQKAEKLAKGLQKLRREK